MLYKGTQGEVFFFFREEERKGKNQVNLGILNTSKDAQIGSLEEDKKVEANCLRVRQVTEAVLMQHITELDDTPLSEQKPLPNPTFVQN